VRTRLLILATVVVISACSDASPSPAAAPATSSSPPPSAGSAAPTTATLPPPVVTTRPILPNPLTAGAIDEATLALMPLRSLEAPLSGFVASLHRRETNEEAIDRLPASFDEAEDIDLYGREDGYRSILRPTRFNGTGTLAVDTWVATFRNAKGASEYLIDYARDLGKRGDAGRAPDLRITDTKTFAVEEVGEEAMGLMLTATDPDTEALYYETLVVFRIGRLLAFVSMFREQEADVRLMLLEVAMDLEERITSVLDGSFEVVEIPPPPMLDSYTFEYTQTLTQRFRAAVEQPQPPRDPGGGDEPDDGDGDPDGGEGGDPGDPGDPGDDPAVTTTEARPVFKDFSTTTAVAASGTVVGDRMACAVSYSSVESSGRRSYVVERELAWVSEGGGAFKKIDPYTEPYGSDLVFCPGWSPSRSDSGVRPVTRPGDGELEMLDDGTIAERFTLGREELVTVGLGGDSASGITLDRFQVLTAGEGPWVVEVVLSMRGTTAAFERAVGPGFYPGANVTIDVYFAADDLNDPELTIDLPG
jgi:hypothetical protein